MTQKIPRRVRRRRQAMRNSMAENFRRSASSLNWFSFGLSVATKKAKEFQQSIGDSLKFVCGVPSIGLDKASGRDRSVDQKIPDWSNKPYAVAHSAKPPIEGTLEIIDEDPVESEFDRIASQILSGTKGPEVGPVWTPSITRREPQQ